MFLAKVPEIYILNTSFSIVKVIDSFKSFIWTERYCDCGDFELEILPSNDIFSVARQNYYVVLPETNTIMIIEGIEINEDPEAGDILKLSGRSLESILDRRVIWRSISADEIGVNALVKRVVRENIISPQDAAARRQISNFAYVDSTDSYILGSTLSFSSVGDTVYNGVKTICSLFGLGFRITIPDFGNPVFTLSLYNGVNRSFSQTDNPYVVFSKSFDNLNSSRYLHSNSGYKNASLVYRKVNDTVSYREYRLDNSAGLNRRELFTDASSISKEEGESSESYNRRLAQQAQSMLLEAKNEEAFEAEADATLMYVYGQDFEMGDIVQFVSEYGVQTPARVTEFIRSWDSEGYKSYPTFVIET